MARWLLVSIIIVLATVNPTIGGIYETLNNALDAMSNVVSIFGSLLFLEEYGDFRDRELPDVTPTHQEVYDFIIVGAGSAGATLAARLSEAKNAKILLIEAGDHENLMMDIPLLAFYLQFDRSLHWDYVTEPSDKYCLGMDDHQCVVPVGKVMGGSSSINAMIATRGNHFFS